VCHSCGDIVDAPAGLVDPLAQRLKDELGFVVDTAHFTVFGRCGRCEAEAREQSTPLVR
jgi:Fur family ferric uptake transcriptional regulator